MLPRVEEDAADRQTAIMYMLARYIIAKDFYLNKEAVANLPENYRCIMRKELLKFGKIKKRIVFDEFTKNTSKAKAVRDQVIVDMREGRNWRGLHALFLKIYKILMIQIIKFATSTLYYGCGP